MIKRHSSPLAASARLAPVLGVGSYSPAEASRLIRMPAATVRRWLGGYSYNEDGERREVAPLWAPQLPAIDDRLELGFRDLIELRFVHSLTMLGLGLNTIRQCFAYAAECVGDARPFSTNRFRTDGRSIFLDTIRNAGADELLDLRKRQYVIKDVVEQSFKDLDFEGDAVARWRPFDGKRSIVIDPNRSFGQPIAERYGVTTTVLAAAAEAEGSIERAAWAYELPASIVRDAVLFEQQLGAA
ncbi:hypothetical protein [Methylopila sp. 73B]|uniref:hypothetical protein n=1 Tax=Methylopila sp. 73B TaxID=1120792 RepID=UPI00056ACA69|nr:hypothetical protein [Methylopila sp. 73B]